MQRTPREEQHDKPCSVISTLEIVGDRWTPLILRDVAVGITRFDVLQRELGVSRKVLTQRLTALVEHEVLVRVPYSEHPPRYDYTLTEKGADLAMVVLAMQQFGDKWVFGEAGPPVQWRHLGCGQVARAVACCEHCGEPVAPGDAVPLRGPSFDDVASPEMGRALDRFEALLG